MSKETVQEKVQQDAQDAQLSDEKQNLDMLIEYQKWHEDDRVFLFGPMMHPKAYHIAKENTCYQKLGVFIGELIESAGKEIARLEALQK